MSKSPISNKSVRLRADHGWQLFSYLIGLGITGSMFIVPLYLFLSGKQEAFHSNIGDGAAPLGFFLVGGAVAVAYVIYEIMKVLREDYVFYVKEERTSFEIKKFDPTQTLQVGPFTDIESKALVVKLRWRPQLENTPHVKSFRLHIHTPPEPTATLDVQFVGRSGDQECEMGRRSVIQKIDLTPRGQGESAGKEYNDWQEIVLPITDSSPQYFLNVNVTVINRYGKNGKLAELTQGGEEISKARDRLSMEIFIGLKLNELKQSGTYKKSNVDVVNICLK